jgi:hypothetical protein
LKNASEDFIDHPVCHIDIAALDGDVQPDFVDLRPSLSTDEKGDHRPDAGSAVSRALPRRFPSSASSRIDSGSVISNPFSPPSRGASARIDRGQDLGPIALPFFSQPRGLLDCVHHTLRPAGINCLADKSFLVGSQVDFHGSNRMSQDSTGHG